MRIVLSECNEIIDEILGQQLSIDLLYSFWFAYYEKGRINDIRRFTGLLRRQDPRYTVYLDSGVYSARRLGVKIPVRELAEYYKKNQDILNYVFNMDAGPVAEQLANLEKLARAGVPVIPIWHGWMDLEVILQMLEWSPYIALSFFTVGPPGSLAQVSPRITNYLDTFFEFLDKQNLNKVPVHALGTENTKLLLTYPFYSADASGYTFDYRTMKAKYFDAQKPGYSLYDLRKDADVRMMPSAADFMACASNKQSGRLARGILAARARVDAQEFVTNAWEKRGITWQKPNLKQQPKPILK